MFEYDRLSLDVAQQFGNQAAEKNNKENLSTGSSEVQLFDCWESPSPPAPEDENAIVHSLSELLRRCSSPGHYLKEKKNGESQFQRNRSATISSHEQHLYSAMISSNMQAQQRHKTAVGNTLSMDLNEHFGNRRLSGGSTIGLSEIFDCGASSGYGSPGAVGGTPMASPAAANSAVHYLAHQLQKMFVDQGFCETVPNGTTAGVNNADIGPAAILPPPTPQSGLSTPMAVPIPIVSPAAIVVKATTTTTGTNKNSNKRKTSLANAAGASPDPETIIATEDGFDPNEIAEFTQLLTSPKRMPPPRYVCHICYQPGHYISDCPQRFNSPYEELTPYQGRKKCYGEFQCEQCKRKWTSQNSVANEAQSCIKCHVPVFPHKQLPVDKAIALGLVKLQRLPVASVTPSPPPLSAGQTPTKQSLLAQSICDAVEEASIFFGLKNDSQANSPLALSPPAIN